MRVQFLLTLLVFCAAAGAQLKDADPEVRSACAATAATPLPADMTGVATPKSYPVCDSYGLYDKKDYAAARACAIEERAALLDRIPDSPSAPRMGIDSAEPDAAGGLVVLTELYANGEGVARSPALAARFFCEAIDTGEVDHEDSDTKYIVATLNQLRGLTSTSPPITFCGEGPQPPPDTPWTQRCRDAAEEAHAEMHFGGIQSGVDDAQKAADDADAAIKPVLAKFSPLQRAAYDRAAAAMQRFIDTQATGDIVYMGGYGSGGLYPNYYHADFEDRVVEYVSQHPAAPAPAEAAKADAELNAVYRKLMEAAAQEATVPHARITDQQLRAEQRAWLAWRDAMVAFGKTLDANLPATAWLQPLTVQRTKDLSDVYDVYGQGWIEDGQKQRQWEIDQATRQNAELAQRRAQIAQFFDHQTPAEAAAWQRVQTALTAYAEAHAAMVPNSAMTPNSAAMFARQQLEALYGELYAFQYNSQHGFMPTDPLKAQTAFAANDKRLNDAYEKDLASPCLTQPVPGDAQGVHRTPEGLSAEQRAWLKLRDAWVDFVGLFYPGENRAALGNMITGGRAFDLDMLMRLCPQQGAAAKAQ